MKLFKIVDSRNKTLYLTSFGFEQAIADFDRIETKARTIEKDRARVVAIKEMTNYNPIPTIEGIVAAFIEAEKRHADNPSSVTALHEFNKLIGIK